MIIRILLALTLLVTPLAAQDWKLVWSDEFDSAGLPDSTRWSYEEGFVRNEELQYYTRARAENAVVRDGMLVIEVRRENFPNLARDKAAGEDWRKTREHAEYTSAALITNNRAAWKYGRIEVRAKLPRGRGVWPAIWMLGANREEVDWPECGEIDIMEYVGFTPDTVYGTVHTGKYNHVAGTAKGSKIYLDKPWEEFHVYGIEWDSSKIDFFVDSTRYFTFENDGSGEGAWPFDKEQYLLLNIAVGGAWGGAKGIDESIFPQQMLIDYVRVYQH